MISSLDAAEIRIRRLLRQSKPSWIPQDPTPKQKMFLDLECLEAFYGGAAGGAKSSALLMAALQYVDVPKYAAILFRRTYADLALPDALMPRAHEWLNRHKKRGGLHWNDKDKTWTFPSGATLTFGYLDTETDKYRYQGSAYQFCVAKGTPVLMADESWKPIEKIVVGDVVATLEGPREVLNTHRPGIKAIFEIKTLYGVAKVSATHRLLTGSGVWASPMALQSIAYSQIRNIVEASVPKPLIATPPYEYSFADRVPAVSLSRQTIGQKERLDSFAWRASGQNDSVAFDGSRQAFWLPQPFSCRLMLCERALRSTVLHPSWHDGRGGQLCLKPQGSPIGYQTDRDFDDAQLHHCSEAVSCGIPPQGDAEERNPFELRQDDQVHIRGRNRLWYVHPYTNERRSSVESFYPADVCMAPAGEAEVFDLTVSSASHYIVSPGIVAQNCGFDELTQFSESMYLYLFSRLRRLANSNIPIRMRSASNPGGIGAKWVQERFIQDDFTPEMAEEQHIFWKDGLNTDGTTVRRAFIPARLNDNPYLDRAEYEQSLNQLDAVTREQLLRGDWQIRERGNVYPMWEDGVEGRHVITWSQFAKVFQRRHIPVHWLGAQGHDPGFDPDPRAAVWNFVAGKNGPLAGDVFCVRELYANRMTVDDFADKTKQLEAPLAETSRIQLRVIGHEASSEQATLQQKHRLTFVKVRPDANGGIAQMRHALRITDYDKPHPFKPHKLGCKDDECKGCLFGRPHFYVVVDDDQLINPKNERGMVNFRAEMAAYRYIDGSPSLTRGQPKIVPYDFFNHLMDAQRNIAVRWFVSAAPLTQAEKIEAALPEALKTANILAEPDADKRVKLLMAQQMRSKMFSKKFTRIPTRDAVRRYDQFLRGKR